MPFRVHLSRVPARTEFVHSYFLVYVSIANEQLSEQLLLELLEVSRRNNARRNVTGMLLYKDQRFLQVLEGSQPTVLEIYSRILHDPRHRDAVVLIQGEEQEREFGDWSMAFQNLDDETARSTPGFSPFLGTN